MKRETDAGLLLELAKLQGQDDKRIDLDDAALTSYVKARINVFRCNKSCPCLALCRFMDFQKRCMTEKYDFQITNHNYVLADLIGRKQGKKPLFPAYGVMVLDEAHKLLDAARQMYSTVWNEQEVELIVKLSAVKGKTEAMDELAVLQGRIAEYNRQVFGRLAGDLSGSHIREGSRTEIVVGPVERSYMKHMVAVLGQLPLSY